MLRGGGCSPDVKMMRLPMTDEERFATLYCNTRIRRCEDTLYLRVSLLYLVYQ